MKKTQSTRVSGRPLGALVAGLVGAALVWVPSTADAAKVVTLCEDSASEREIVQLLRRSVGKEFSKTEFVRARLSKPLRNLRAPERLLADILSSAGADVAVACDRKARGKRVRVRTLVVNRKGETLFDGAVQVKRSRLEQLQAIAKPTAAAVMEQLDSSDVGLFGGV